ncbi:uncharacterized protein HMPREF1541_08741 [Cyphellophora europaea CBS 101466]|uniref:Survival Motor Neuron Gemin2-binding domain-containing protein n=1 Tax=Cyphellophora europaea (strain CBS 101466) TaxID=1220924 RepID=W2RL86_CYPE1|nr:uncharacterized protein HMPREF1541_08741 [Cyphellophora europaea CBS 101466]ETN36463.1 hypothetical protein HMPREF1541_08741 [Cyphellophora europaea CBS 101466]
MPKHKKAKTSHPGAGSQTRGNLSHAEIWDDSALVRSWNEAVKEYEYYHSLVAQGLDVETILDQAEAAEANGETPALGLEEVVTHTTTGAIVDVLPPTTNESDEENEEGEVRDEPERQPTAQERQAALKRAGLTLDSTTTANSEPATTAQGPMEDSAAPKSALHQPEATAIGPDQTLENLKMAYYWAGYYSGLHDGQRQASARIGESSIS